MEVADGLRRHRIDQFKFEEFDPVFQAEGPRLKNWRDVFNKIIHADMHNWNWRMPAVAATATNADDQHVQWDRELGVYGTHSQSGNWYYRLDVERLLLGSFWLIGGLQRFPALREE
jgi:hypothetical protein